MRCYLFFQRCIWLISLMLLRKNTTQRLLHFLKYNIFLICLIWQLALSVFGSIKHSLNVRIFILYILVLFLIKLIIVKFLLKWFCFYIDVFFMIFDILEVCVARAELFLEINKIFIFLFALKCLILQSLFLLVFWLYIMWFIF